MLIKTLKMTAMLDQFVSEHPLDHCFHDIMSVYVCIAVAMLQEVQQELVELLVNSVCG
jgi:hypothetical protein